ncbi:MAG: LacI family DNA-binding transcriptional regulator [Lachnospiraceae bacterium]|nr:LacI family DNA-binding transcriptional regulator [Lachnospiraceae bacterium]
MATLTDIAKMCHVSKSTISRVLNNDPDFSVAEKTREQIISAATSLNYDMNKQRKTRKKAEGKNSSAKASTVLRIGILNYSFTINQNTDDFYSKLISSIITALKDMTCPYDFEFRYIFKDSYEELNDLDGLIVVGKLHLNPYHPTVANIKYKVIVDYIAPQGAFDSVRVNFTDVIQTAVDYFHSLGLTNICYVGGFDYITQFAEYKRTKIPEFRQNAFYEYCLQNKINPTDHIWNTDSFTPEDGYAITKEIITGGKLPEALLFGSDELSLGAYKAFQEYDIQIGKDLSIISIDNMPYCGFLNPPLTSISLNLPYMGETTALALISQINGRSFPIAFNPPVNLVVRKSCIPQPE